MERALPWRPSNRPNSASARALRSAPPADRVQVPSGARLGADLPGGSRGSVRPPRASSPARRRSSAACASAGSVPPDRLERGQHGRRHVHGRAPTGRATQACVVQAPDALARAAIDRPAFSRRRAASARAAVRVVVSRAPSAVSSLPTSLSLRAPPIRRDRARSEAPRGDEARVRDGPGRARRRLR